MSRLSLFLLAFALATAAFWLTMLTDPPRSAAGVRTRPSPIPLSVQPLRNRFVPEELCGRFGACPD